MQNANSKRVSCEPLGIGGQKAKFSPFQGNSYVFRTVCF